MQIVEVAEEICVIAGFAGFNPEAFLLVRGMYLVCKKLVDMGTGRLVHFCYYFETVTFGVIVSDFKDVSKAVIQF